jgi:hypothetical protein
MIVSIQRETDCRSGCPLGPLGSELAELEYRPLDEAVVRHPVSKNSAITRPCLRTSAGALLPLPAGLALAG